jgi:hypothetical protein
VVLTDRAGGATGEALDECQLADSVAALRLLKKAFRGLIREGWVSRDQPPETE